MITKWIIDTWRHDDMQYMIRNGKFRIVKTIVQITSGLVLVWYLGRSKALLGEFQFLNYLIGLLSIFALIGMRDAIMRSVARGHEHSLKRGTWYAVAVSIIGSLVLSGYAAYRYWIGGDAGIARALLVCAVLFPFYRSFDYFATYLVARQRFDTECRMSSVVFLARMAATLIAAYYFPNRVWIVIGAFLGTHILISACFYERTAREIERSDKDPELFPFARFATYVNGFMMIAQTVDIVLVGMVKGSTELAVYFVGTVLFEKACYFMDALFVVLAPRFANETMRLTGRKMIMLLFGGVGLAVMACGGFLLMIRLFFPQYPESIPIGLWISLGMAPAPLNRVCGIYFKSIKHERAIMTPVLASRIYTIVFCLPFLTAWGLMGLVWLRITEQIINFAFNFYYWRKT